MTTMILRFTLFLVIFTAAGTAMSLAFNSMTGPPELRGSIFGSLFTASLFLTINPSAMFEQKPKDGP